MEASRLHVKADLNQFLKEVGHSSFELRESEEGLERKEGATWERCISWILPVAYIFFHSRNFEAH